MTREELALVRELVDLAGDLVEQTEAASIAEVIRRALALYDMAVTSERNGGRLLIEHADGTQERIVLLDWKHHGL